MGYTRFNIVFRTIKFHDLVRAAAHAGYITAKVGSEYTGVNKRKGGYKA